MNQATEHDGSDVPGTLPVDRADGSTELDMRNTFGVLFLDPAVRNFTFAALGALGMIFLILFQQGSDIGGVLILLIGACGLLLRWFASPIFVLIILAYFMIFPFGVPWDSFESKWEISDGRFRVTDVMLVLSVLVYIACQYRIYGFVSQAIPFEAPNPPQGRDCGAPTRHAYPTDRARRPDRNLCRICLPGSNPLVVRQCNRGRTDR